MTRAAPLLLLTACFNFDADFQAYCQRTGRCDAGSSAGGGSAASGGSGGGTAVGGGGGATGGGTGGFAGGTGGASTDGGCINPSQCTSPLNGMATCVANACGFACNTNFNRCGFSCVSNNDPMQCGPACVVCPAPTNGLGTRACDAGVCDFTCINNYRRCGDQCVSVTSTTACGPSCTPCSAPTGGSPFCDAGLSCDFNCQSGFTKVNGRCTAPPNLTFPNLADVTDPSTFVDVRIDPSSASTLWAVDFSGQVLVSSNLGGAFTPICRMPGSGLDPTWSGFKHRADTRVLVSPGPDRTTYVTTSNPASTSFNSRVLRVESDGGTVCRDITPGSGFSYGGNSSASSSVTVAPDGTLYFYDSYSFGGHVLRSVDRGATWQSVVDAGTLPATFAQGTLNAGPNGDVLLTVNNSTTGGLFLITDAGSVVTRVSATIFSNEMMPRWSAAHPGYAYAGRGSTTTEGFFTNNGGRNWMQSAAHAVSGDWSVDPVTGAGYRFVVYDGGLNLERAADLRTPAWSRTGGFWPGVTGLYDRVDSAGNTVTAVVGGRLFVSQDSATSFSRVGMKPPIVTGANSLASDGTRVVLVDNRGNVFESTDQGRTYVLEYTPPPIQTPTNGWLEVNLHPAAPLNAIVRPVDAFVSTGLVTHDGFTSAAPVNLTIQPYYSAFAWAPTSLTQAYLYGPSSFSAFSQNTGDSWGALALTPVLNNGFSSSLQAVVTGDPTFGLVAECSSGVAHLWRVNNVLRLTSDIGSTVSNQLGNDLPCAMELYVAGAGLQRVRVISRTGWLAVSDNDGLSFTGVPGASGGLTSCTQRRLTSLSTDRSVVVTWCQAQNQLAVSRNGGSTWTNIGSGLNFANYGCAITSLYPLATQLLIGCRDRPPVLVDY